MSNVTNTTQGNAGRTRRIALLGSVLLLSQLPAHAGPYEQAKRIYERIAGVPPPPAALTTMAQLICGNGTPAACAPGAAGAAPGSAGLVAAAAWVTACTGSVCNAPTFYNVTIKNMVIPWTNRNQTVFAPLNDYAATVIGMVRDDVAFNTALSADLLYTVSGVSPAPSNANNTHYATAESNGVDLSSKLVASTQSGAYGTPTTATAGLLTTYGAEQAFFINGTNRAMFRYTMMNHFCNDLPTLEDTTRPTDRVRQDVARSPGGDSRVFLNTCVGCHSGMDPMAQAFAYYNFNGTLGAVMNTGTMQYTSGQVQPKYLINSTNFVWGFITPDDSWSNRWRTGVNAWLGWSSALPGSGSGAKSLGTEIESAQQFATCQVTKVFQAVCFRAPQSTADLATVNTITSAFTAGGYKLKQVFQQSAAACPGN
jgi:hypothetical protein